MTRDDIARWIPYMTRDDIASADPRALNNPTSGDPYVRAFLVLVATLVAISGIDLSKSPTLVRSCRTALLTTQRFFLLNAPLFP